jgi:hypothetical protein
MEMWSVLFAEDEQKLVGIVMGLSNTLLSVKEQP